jgi:hypothetical protein
MLRMPRALVAGLLLLLFAVPAEAGWLGGRPHPRAYSAWNWARVQGKLNVYPDQVAPRKGTDRFEHGRVVAKRQRNRTVHINHPFVLGAR